MLSRKNLGRVGQHKIYKGRQAEPGQSVAGFGLACSLDLDGQQPAVGLARRGRQGDGGDSARSADLDHALGAYTGGQRTEELGAGRFEIAMPERLWKPVCILL